MPVATVYSFADLRRERVFMRLWSARLFGAAGTQVAIIGGPAPGAVSLDPIAPRSNSDAIK